MRYKKTTYILNVYSPESGSRLDWKGKTPVPYVPNRIGCRMWRTFKTRQKALRVMDEMLRKGYWVMLDKNIVRPKKDEVWVTQYLWP